MDQPNKERYSLGRCKRLFPNVNRNVYGRNMSMVRIPMETRVLGSKYASLIYTEVGRGPGGRTMRYVMCELVYFEY